MNLISKFMGKPDFVKKASNSSSTEDVIDIFNDPKHPLSWVDSATGLIWEVKNAQNYDSRYTFDEAQEYAKGLNRKHYNDSGNWRVPTIEELMTLGSAQLFDYREKSVKYSTRQSWKEKIANTKNGRLFVKKPLSGFMNKQIETWYWSSTAVNNFQKNLSEKSVERMTEAGWTVNFFEGGNYHNTKTQKNSVICVRNS